MILQEKPSFIESEHFRSASAVVLLLLCSIAAEITLGASSLNSSILFSLGRVILISSLIYLLHRFSLQALSQYRPTYKDLIAMVVVMVGMFVLIAVSRIISISVLNHFKALTLPGLSELVAEIDPRSLHFAIPFALGGILMQAVLGLQYGLVFGFVLSLVLGVYYPEEAGIVPYTIATTLVGCLSMVKFRSRGAYVRAGLNVALIGILFAFCFSLIQQDVSSLSTLVAVCAALLCGIVVSFLVAGLTPVIEYLGGYVTDMSLLEMATLDHALLKELSISAPGTWNHSMVMGMMAEAAADSIGANAVLTRVACYFHDIGKMKNPLYFSENQVRGENRHDKLSPSMSALIIRSHVKDGIKMAKQHRVPKPIIDMIPQHHGTSVIGYFYDKAKKEAEESGEGVEIDRELYSYPGPKPQTKEAGIIMLADGVEAAARTLPDPSLDKIQGMVQKMINRVFTAGQLDECQLTLQNLHAIAKCFTRVLNGIYHQRVSYPESVEKGSEKHKEEEIEEKKSPQKNGEKKVKARKSAKIDTNAPASQNGPSELEKNDEASQQQKEPKVEEKKKKKEDLKRLGL
ncbi:MAG: HDIG domain-containing protein [Bdellovibrionales bacterium]|nr:HDIG domain-containing protein [Bdellovibrionales bacterium]